MAKKRSFKPNWLLIGGGLAAAWYVWKSQAAKVVSGIAGTPHIKRGKTKYDLDVLYGYEPFFDKMIPIAMIYEKSKIVQPTHGYYLPHPLGKKAKKWALKNGYEFRQN